ncbi:MAG: Glycosyltransferase [Parcubacteria group bacterium GW2011_GWA2_49_16]|nr:MAG: Glycosyltransferase [Parcubacteria group bacterium GW2011_GWA2_49_16]
MYDDSLDRPDGVSQYVKTLGAWLGGQGHQVVYLVGETKLKQWAGAPVFSLSRNLSVNFNGNQVNTPLLASTKAINQVLAKHQLDVLHVQMPYSPLLAGRVINRASPQTAVVGTFHIYPAGFLAHAGSRFLKLLCLGSLHRFETVLNVSSASSSFGAAAFGLRTIDSSNVVELKRFVRAKNKPQPYHIFFLGRLVKRKGCLQLLRAFKLLSQAIPEARLSIAGDGPARRQLQDYVEHNNLQSSVKFLGFINEKDKPELLASASVACFPSLGGESFGIVLIEAMAAGVLVVLGGNNPGYTSVLGERPETLFDPKDISQLALKLERFMSDERLASSVHEWQQTHVRNYDIETVGPKILKLYNEVIDKRALSGHN